MLCSPSRSRLQLCFQGCTSLLEVGDIAFDTFQPLLAGGVLFLLERLAFDLKLHHAALEVVQLLRVAGDLHA